MKFCYLFIPVLLSGCVFGTTNEIKKAELMVNKFNCENIETNEIAHSSVTSFHEQSLYGAKQKAVDYLNRYKQGEKIFKMPLPEVIEQQFILYTDACQNLGGVQTDHPPAQP